MLVYCDSEVYVFNFYLQAPDGHMRPELCRNQEAHEDESAITFKLPSARTYCSLCSTHVQQNGGIFLEEVPHLCEILRTF